MAPLPSLQYLEPHPLHPWQPVCPSSEHQRSSSYPPEVEGDTNRLRLRDCSVSKCFRILRPNSHLLALIGRIDSTFESFLRHLLWSPHLLLSSVRSHLTLSRSFCSYYHLNARQRRSECTMGIFLGFHEYQQRKLDARPKRGSSGQGSVWVGKFRGFLNLSNIITLDGGRGQAGRV